MLKLSLVIRYLIGVDNSHTWILIMNTILVLFRNTCNNYSRYTLLVRFYLQIKAFLFSLYDMIQLCTNIVYWRSCEIVLRAIDCLIINFVLIYQIESDNSVTLFLHISSCFIHYDLLLVDVLLSVGFLISFVSWLLEASFFFHVYRLTSTI